jgi:hypothetical protein
LFGVGQLSKDHLIAQEAERVAEEEKAAKLRAEQEAAAEREKRKGKTDFLIIYIIFIFI